MRLSKPLNILLLLTIYLINLPQICYSEERKLVVLGTPFVKVESFSDQTKRYELTNKQMKEYQVMISQEGNKFYWNSREGKELKRNATLGFVYYVNAEGSGYIKISNVDNSYMEHITLGLATITYWGKLER